MEVKKQKIGNSEEIIKRGALVKSKPNTLKPYNEKVKIVQGKYITSGKISAVMDMNEFRELSRNGLNETAKKTVAALTMATVIGSTVVSLNANQTNVTSSNNVETMEVVKEAKMVTAPKSLFGGLVAPVMDAKVNNEAKKVTYTVAEGVQVYSPIAGVLHVDGEKVRIVANDYTAVLENVTATVQDGSVMEMGSELGSSKGDVTMSVFGVANEVVKNPGQIALEVTAEEKELLVDQVAESKVSAKIESLNPKIKDFLKAFDSELVNMFEESGILPSTIAAQGILESTHGTSELAGKANNLFGHKAHSDWEGETVEHLTPEETNGVTTMVYQIFRKYDTWEDCVKAHFQQVLQKDRYSKAIGETDYKAQIRAIVDAGYATDSEYYNKVVNKIEELGLDDLNDAVLQKDSTTYAEMAKVALSNEETVKEIETSYQKNVGEVKEATKPKQQTSAKKEPQYITDVTVGGTEVVVNVGGSNITLGNVDVANLSSEGAYEIITQLKASGDYKVVKNTMLEKLLQLLNNGEMNQYLTGHYENKMLDKLVELAGPIIGKTEPTPSEETKIEALLEGKMTLKGNGKTYTFDGEYAINKANERMDQIESIPVDYADLTFTESNFDLGGEFILIDAGHSIAAGKHINDPGTASSINGLNEGQVNWQMALKLKDAIEKNGGKAQILQADGKHNYKAQERPYIANEIKPDMFISIHSDASENPATKGGSAVYYQNDQVDGKALAEAMQKYQKQALPTLENRGAKESNYAVNRDSDMTSVLIEAVFLSDPYECLLIENELVQDSLVNAYVAGIADYLGVETVEEPKAEESTETVEETEEEKRARLLKIMADKFE